MAEPEDYLTPEAGARVAIDRMLEAAGWAVQNYSSVDLSASRGVAVREFVMKPPHGRADYPAVPRRLGRRRGRGQAGRDDADRRLLPNR
jgi:hypothetical protein